MSDAKNAIALANLVVDAINDADLEGLEGTGAQRRYFIDHELQKLTAAKTSVVIAAIRSERTMRGGTHQVEIDIDVGLQARSDGDDNSDALMETVDGIVETVSTDLGDFSFLASERKFINDAEGIKTRKVFTAVTTFTFSYYAG